MLSRKSILLIGEQNEKYLIAEQKFKMNVPYLEHSTERQMWCKVLSCPVCSGMYGTLRPSWFVIYQECDSDEWACCITYFYGKLNALQ